MVWRQNRVLFESFFQNIERNQMLVHQAFFYMAGSWSSLFSGEKSKIQLGKACELIPYIFPGLFLSVLKNPL